MDKFLCSLDLLKDRFEKGTRVVYISGPIGCGKTLHLRALCRAFQIPLLTLASASAPGDLAGLRRMILREVGSSHGGEADVTWSETTDPIVTSLRQRRRPCLAIDHVDFAATHLLPYLSDLLDWVDNLQIVLATREETLDLACFGHLSVGRVVVRPLATYRSGSRSIAGRYFRHYADRIGKTEDIEAESNATTLIETIVCALKGRRRSIEHVVSFLGPMSLSALGELPQEKLLRLEKGTRKGGLQAWARAKWVSLTPAERRVACYLLPFQEPFHSDVVVPYLQDMLGHDDADDPARAVGVGAIRIWASLPDAYLVWKVDRARWEFDPNIRMCASESMHPDERRQLKDEHTDWLLSQGLKRAATAIGGREDSASKRGGARRWLERAEADLDEIRRRALEAEPVDVRRLHRALVCLSPLPSFQLNRQKTLAYLEEAVRLGDESPEQTEPRVRGELRRLLGRAKRYSKAHSLDEVFSHLEVALIDAKEADDQLLMARVRTALVEAHNRAGRSNLAQPLCEEALKVHAGAAVAGWVGISKCQLGRIHDVNGKHEAAEALWESALADLARAGDVLAELHVRNHLVTLALQRLDLERARDRAVQVVEQARESGFDRLEAIAKAYLALAVHHGDDDAEAVVEAYDDLFASCDFERVGAADFGRYFHYYRALAHLEQDHFDEAEEDLDRAGGCDDPEYGERIACARAALACHRSDSPAAIEPVLCDLGGPDGGDDAPRDPLRDLPRGAAALAKERLFDAESCLRRMETSGDDEARLGARVLRAWLSKHARWRFTRDGRWVRKMGSDWLEIGEGQSRSLLRELVDAHLSGLDCVSHDALIKEVWSVRAKADPTDLKRCLTTAIHLLRKDIRVRDPGGGGWVSPIENVRGRGYRLSSAGDVLIQKAPDEP